MSICFSIILDDRCVSTSYTSVQNAGWPPTRRGLGTCRALVGWDEPMVSSWGDENVAFQQSAEPLKWIQWCIDIPSNPTSCEFSRSKLFLFVFKPRDYTPQASDKVIGSLGEWFLNPWFVWFCVVHWITSQSIGWFLSWGQRHFLQRGDHRLCQCTEVHGENIKNKGKSWSNMWNRETFLCLQNHGLNQHGPHGLVVFLVAWSTSCVVAEENLWKWFNSWRCCDGRELKICFQAWFGGEHVRRLLTSYMSIVEKVETIWFLCFFSEKRYPNPNWEHISEDVSLPVSGAPLTLAMFFPCHDRCRRWAKFGDVWGQMELGCVMFGKNNKVMSKKVNMLCWYHWWKSWYINQRIVPFARGSSVVSGEWWLLVWDPEIMMSRHA